jgi:hypothetical protein
LPGTFVQRISLSGFSLTVERSKSPQCPIQRLAVVGRADACDGYEDLGQPAHSNRVNDRLRLTVMKQPERFLAKLSGVCVLLLGTTVMNFAWAAKLLQPHVTATVLRPGTEMPRPRSHHVLRQPRSHRVLSTALGARPNLNGVRLILVSRS